MFQAAVNGFVNYLASSLTRIQFNRSFYFSSVAVSLIMVALWNRADHYIFILSFVLLLLSSSSFFPRLISAATDWMSAILPHMVWP